MTRRPRDHPLPRLLAGERSVDRRHSSVETVCELPDEASVVLHHALPDRLSLAMNNSIAQSIQLAEASLERIVGHALPADGIEDIWEPYRGEELGDVVPIRITTPG